MKSEIIKIYEFFKQVKWNEEADDWDEQIFELAKSSEDDLLILVSLFKKESDPYYKLRLADILARLKYKEIASFLLEVIRDGNIEDKYDATFCLVHLEHNASLKMIKTLYGLIKQSKEKVFTKSCLIGDLRDINNKMAREILKKVFDPA